MDTKQHLHLNQINISQKIYLFRIPMGIYVCGT